VTKRGGPPVRRPEPALLGTSQAQSRDTYARHCRVFELAAGQSARAATPSTTTGPAPRRKPAPGGYIVPYRPVSQPPAATYLSGPAIAALRATARMTENKAMHRGVYGPLFWRDRVACVALAAIEQRIGEPITPERLALDGRRRRGAPCSHRDGGCGERRPKYAAAVALRRLLDGLREGSIGKLSKIIGSESQGRRPRHGISSEHRSSLTGRSELLPIRLVVGPNDPILVQIMRCRTRVYRACVTCVVQSGPCDARPRAEAAESGRGARAVVAAARSACPIG
jgi:hypothetical protein